MAEYARISRSGHALADRLGRVLTHRAVLFDEIGDGWHACNWCGKQIEWRKADWSPDALTVDHLDGDITNNTVSNLVPSCRVCNRLRADESRLACPKGHPYDKLIVRACGRKYRACSTCLAEQGRRYHKRKVNLTKGELMPNGRIRLTHCKNGHEFTPENTAYHSTQGHRVCRQCRNESNARRPRERAAEIGRPKRTIEVPDRTTEPARRELPEPERQPEKQPERTPEKVPVAARVLAAAGQSRRWW